MRLNLRAESTFEMLTQEVFSTANTQRKQERVHGGSAPLGTKLVLGELKPY